MVDENIEGALLPKVAGYELVAEPFHCDFSNHLFLGHLGNQLLNAADFHSNERGYGMTYLNPRKKTWVLSRLAIEMEQMPKAYDKYKVETWVDDVMKFFTSRNFAVTSDIGTVYGYGRSIWALIDTDSRQPTDILTVHDGLIRQYIETEKVCPIAKSSRVKMGHEARLDRTLTTHYSDVDVNGHINSVKYIEHVLDLFDIAFYRQHHLQRFEIAYVAESHQGDVLRFYQEEIEEDTFAVRLTKITPSSQEEIEVVRCKVKFVKV